MKKILLYLLGFIFVCFVIPAILTKRTVLTSAKENDNEQIEENSITEEEYDYSKYGTITLLHSKTRRNRTSKYR